jgi:hypothetical protein
MHEAKEEHDIRKILRSFPAMVKGDLRPPSLGQNLHHDILRMHETAEIAELPILAVGITARNIVEVIK